jgi:mercuric ion transport protein
MMRVKSSGTFMGAGVFSAIAASLCCITPVIGLLAGSSSIAANFSWIEPIRPYLIGLSVVVLAFAWYLKLKPANSVKKDCNCDTKSGISFWQSKIFLAIVTAFATLMMTFPLYARVFYSKPGQLATVVNTVKNKQVKFTIVDMTCAGCEEHINSKLAKVKGVVQYQTSYATQSSLVTYNPEKINVSSIADAINKTGYKVKGYEFTSASKIIKSCCEKN